MSRTSQTLMEMYDAMHQRFGHQGWWPGETPLEVCLGAILTQNTNWRNVEKALANLRARDALDIRTLHEMDPIVLAELIRPAGYYNIKARRLKNFVAAAMEYSDGDLDAFLDGRPRDLRERLLPIKGIGRETADSIILYAARKPSFVVDTYTHRVLMRHNLIAPEDDYEAIKDLFERSLPEDVALWNDYHAQLVAVGKSYCRPRPRCTGCPLEPFPHDPLAGTTEAW